jgi:hypothetical protein
MSFMTSLLFLYDGCVAYSKFALGGSPCLESCHAMAYVLIVENDTAIEAHFPRFVFEALSAYVKLFELWKQCLVKVAAAMRC